MAPCVTRFSGVPPTCHALEWAELETIDLSLLHEVGGKEKLASQLKRVLQQPGIFYISNFSNIPASDIDAQFSLAKAFFDLPFEEKIQFHAKKFRGGYLTGLKKDEWPSDGAPENVQIYMMPKLEGCEERHHPRLIMERIGELEGFTKVCHENILLPLLSLIAKILELPEEEMLRIVSYEKTEEGKYDEPGECQYRWTHYDALSEEEQKNNPIYAGAHEDFNFLTFHFRQPIAGLQIPSPNNEDGKWEWVKPKDNAIICNVGQALEALSGGLFKAALHRVHVPPPDQAVYDRVGALLFTQPDIDYSLNPLAGSPLLQREGRENNYHKAFGKDNTMRKWVGGFRGSGKRNEKAGVMMGREGC